MASAPITIQYAPRKVFLPFHTRTQRFAVGVAHRRCGKTVACINDKVRKAALSDKHMYRAAYIAPYLKQAKDVAWEYLKQYSRPLWSKPPNESELYVELLNGQRIRIYGADNAEALRGGYFDDATLDEYADMAPSVWGSIIRPMLADRQGSATFIGTPKGRNSFYEIFERAKTDPDWFWFMLRASETKLLPQSELDAARQDMTQEQYDQEFECSFDAAILGAYFGKEIAIAEREGRVGKFEADPEIPVHCAWDLGVGDSTAIWFFQMAGPQIHVIDHYEASGFAIEHYAEVKKRKGYRYGDDFVPHDAKVREFSRSTGAEDGHRARQRVEVMLELGLKPVVVTQHRVEDGINAARRALSRCWFNAETTGPGMEALRQYRADFDEKARAFKNAPKHDWTSHTADAFRYLAMAWEEIAKPVQKTDVIAELLRPKTLNEMLREHDLEQEEY